MRSTERLRVIVLGYIVRGPLGGLAWHYLQYVMGLSRLGHDVYYLEDAGDYESCYDPRTGTMSTDPSFGLEFTAGAFDRVGLGDRWAYFDSHGGRWLGPASSRVADVCRSADVVLNISAVNPLRPWLRDVPARVLIDTDPGFTQIQHLTRPDRLEFARAHNAFFTFGENIPGGTSRVPADGLPWQPTRQPIVLEAWPVTPGPSDGRFTTIMVWNSYSAVEYAGRRYGMKSDSFDAYLRLPQLADGSFELACGALFDPAPLAEQGWRLRNPLELASDPWIYQRYIQSSKAEFSVAKHGYVAARTGWFSERSAAYLASGRPVVVQDTGFSEWLQADAGVIPFSNLEEAVEGIARINNDYRRQCEAARTIAAECFDARTVLTSLTDRLLGQPQPA